MYTQLHVRVVPGKLIGACSARVGVDEHTVHSSPPSTYQRSLLSIWILCVHKIKYFFIARPCLTFCLPVKAGQNIDRGLTVWLPIFMACFSDKARLYFRVVLFVLLPERVGALHWCCDITCWQTTNMLTPSFFADTDYSLIG